MFTVLLVVGGWIFSLCLHEYAHARVAYAGGDTSVKDKGYLSFNPLRYADPMMSIAMPLLMILIGGIALPGGSVYIETWRLKSRWWDSAVSAAGPAANALLVIPIAIAMQFAPDDTAGFWAALAFLGQTQVAAVLFNLLPIPGLDGFGILAPLYTREERHKITAYGRYALFGIYLIMWNVPGVGQVYWDIVNNVSGAVGISPDVGYQGYDEFRNALPWK
jgi:Zn-dependent protease